MVRVSKFVCLQPSPRHRGLHDFRLPVASALPGSTFELSAPLPWKRVLRLAVSAGFKPHDDDLEVFRKQRTLHSAHRDLAVKIWEKPEKNRRWIGTTVLAFVAGWINIKWLPFFDPSMNPARFNARTTFRAVREGSLGIHSGGNRHSALEGRPLYGNCISVGCEALQINCNGLFDVALF